jgi:hypothetical protein
MEMKVCMDVDLIGAPAWLRSLLFGVVTHGYGEMVSSLHVKFPIRGCPLILPKGRVYCPYVATS